METPPYIYEPTAPVNVLGVADEVTQTACAPSERTREPFARFRRRIDLLRLDRDAAGPVAGDVELKLELMLLREENIRLKSERHRPSDASTLVDRMRPPAVEKDHGETDDEAWFAFSQCLLLREDLAQASIELDAAIAAIRERLVVVLDDDSIDPVTPAALSVTDAA